MLKLREFISFYEHLFLISFLIIFIAIPISQSADVKSFCKCVCVNSTIVPLRTDQSCSDCNIAFCIDLMKDGVKEGTPKEGCEVPVCFQRDSYKDEIIVYFYIIITSGLLLIALTKPFIEKWWKRTNPPHVYTSMPNS